MIKIESSGNRVLERCGIRDWSIYVEIVEAFDEASY